MSFQVVMYKVLISSHIFQSVDPLLGYLAANLRVLSEKLDSSIYPKLLQQIWDSSLRCFKDSLAVGVRSIFTRKLCIFRTRFLINENYFLKILKYRTTDYAVEGDSNMLILPRTIIQNVPVMLKRTIPYYY